MVCGSKKHQSKVRLPATLRCHRGLHAGNAEATARVVEGLINGVGFIGGGAILVGKLGTRGTATAASIWATGAIGVAVGLSSYDTELVLSIATSATLRSMTSFKSSENEVLTPPPDKL